MADNVAITAGTGTTIATDDVSGVQYQKVKLVDGTADSAALIAGDSANGLDVDVTRLPALVAGSALIGKVSIDQATANANEVVVKSAIPAGTNNIGDVDVATLPALAAGSNLIGKVASVMVTADADLTQLITVAAAGTPVQGPAVTNPGGWMIKADPANTGSVWLMFHGQTKAAKGFPLGVGESTIPPVESLADLDFDADTSGGKIHAMKL